MLVDYEHGGDVDDEKGLGRYSRRVGAWGSTGDDNRLGRQRGGD